MIKLNLKNTTIKTTSFKKLNNKTKTIHTKLHSGKTPWTGWVDYPTNISKTLINDINKTTKKIQKESDVLLVIGIGGSYMGAKAAIDSIYSQFKKPKTEVIFIGYSLAEKHILQLKDYLKNKKFSINVISKSGTTLETLATFEEFKKLLKKQKGKDYTKFIYATTDKEKGKLKEEAIKNNYKTFDLLDSIGGRYSVLTPVGLLPLAVAGIDIKEVVSGAKVAHKDLTKTNNQAYKYAQARYLLSKKYFVELLVTYSPDYFNMMNWIQQLYGESEGKNNKGVFPVPSLFSRDLHSIGQFIQDGRKNMFITTSNIKDNSNKLIFKNANKSFTQINDIIFNASVKAHFKTGKVENIVLDIQEWTPKTLGYYLYFHMKACAMTSYLTGVNPFDQPGVEVYKDNTRRSLKFK